MVSLFKFESLYNPPGLPTPASAFNPQGDPIRDGRPGGRIIHEPTAAFTGNQLNLNVQVRSGGRIRIGLLDAEGRPLPKFSVRECVPISGDWLGKSVEWKGGGDVGGGATKPTRLRIEMSDTRLLGFQFTSGKARGKPR